MVSTPQATNVSSRISAPLRSEALAWGEAISAVNGSMLEILQQTPQKGVRIFALPACVHRKQFIKMEQDSKNVRARRQTPSVTQLRAWTGELRPFRPNRPRLAGSASAHSEDRPAASARKAPAPRRADTPQACTMRK